MYVDQLMYWVSHVTVEMSSLDGSGRVMLLNESRAWYMGITLYNNFLYISDTNRQLALNMYIVSPLKNYNLDITLIRK